MYYYLINNAGLMTTRGSYTQHYIILNDNIYWKMRVECDEKKSEKMKNAREWNVKKRVKKWKMSEMKITYETGSVWVSDENHKADDFAFPFPLPPFRPCSLAEDDLRRLVRLRPLDDLFL